MLAEDESITLEEVQVDVEAEWTRFRRLCSEAMGIERNPQALAALPDQLEELSRLPLSEDRSALELRSAAILARLMSRAAGLRTESRGVHHRVDMPDPEPAWAGVRLRIALTDLP